MARFGYDGGKATHQSEYYVNEMWGHDLERTGYGLDINLKP